MRVTAYVLRFINIAKGKAKRQIGELEASEILAAENVWIKHSQSTYFNKEIRALEQKQPLEKSSSLLKLNPFMDDDNVMRLSGRIKRSNMPYDTVHPIVLDGKCAISHSLAKQAHKAMLHAGIQASQHYMRQKYWIIGSRMLLKTTISNCIPCFRQRKETQNQLMAHLPSERVNPGRAFQSTSVDYAGPVHIKRYNAQRTKIIDKGYIAVFVCTRVKTMHLELVSSLSTEAFLAAFSRFSNRRGRIQELIADNATTFKGAENEQEKIYNSWRKAATSEMMQTTTTKWKFIPPSAPHMGGLHEAAVKSAKHHLRRVIGAQQLTFEELATLLVQVEGCLNSRPMIALSEDANDSLALTPAHFLIGEPIIAPLTRDYGHMAINKLSQFQRTTKMVQDFWDRWSKEYVTTLMYRTKWYSDQREVQEGDIVLVVNEILPPTQWALGRIIKTIKGDDGHVRVVDVFSKGQTYRRPIVKICVLPIEEHANTLPGGEHVQNEQID